MGQLALHSFVEESVEYLQHQSIVEGKEDKGEKNNERMVKTGVLLCQDCKVWYPINSYVPVMLVFETRFHKQFAKQYEDQLKLLSDYRMPNGSPQPGETSVQETFTDEWDCVQNDELTFLYSIEDLRQLYQKVWLKWIGSVERRDRECSEHWMWTWM